MQMSRTRFTVRRLMAVVAVVAVIMGVLVQFLKAVDAAIHGPYATAFNQSCQQLADRAGLVGSPESDVVKVLGKPTSVWRYWSVRDLTDRPAAGAYLITTYNFGPVPSFRAGSFRSIASEASLGRPSNLTTEAAELSVIWLFRCTQCSLAIAYHRSFCRTPARDTVTHGQDRKGEYGIAV